MRRRKNAVPDQADDVVGELSKLFRDITTRRLAEFERVIGLPTANQEFREQAISAVSTCIFTHTLEPHATRASQIRKDLLRARDTARKAHDSLCNLDAALSALPEFALQLLEQHWGLSGDIARRFMANEVSWLRAVSSLADLSAKAFVDKGGRPEMRAFRVLALGLAKAFKAGTGRRATVSWNDAKGEWSGKFMKLVEAVLPLAKTMAAAITERPLLTPVSPLALGKYLHDLTQARSK